MTSASPEVTGNRGRFAVLPENCRPPTPAAFLEKPSLPLPPETRSSGEADLSPRRSRLILGLIALLYLGTCFTPVIFDDNEGLYAASVREMAQRHDWLVPMSNGFPRVQKPPLVYWMMLVSRAVFGESEFALRLPNALATAGWIAATYLLARRLGGERGGIASALVLASMLGVWVFTHLVQPEPFLACFLSLALWCLVEARLSAPEKGGRWYFRFWIFLALGTMSKGLHGALWPLGTAGLAALFVPSWRPWLRLLLRPAGPAAFLLLVAPWYVYMALRFPGFLPAHFLNEQLGASLNTRYPSDARQLPVAQFYGQHLLFWLPWVLFLPAALVRARRVPSLPPPAADIVKLLGLWFGLVMVSVVFSTRQDYYSLCSWGAAAAFLALPWLGRERSFLILGPCLLIAAVGLFSLGFAGWTESHLSALAGGTAAPLENRDTFMAAITGLSPALWSRMILLLWIFGATTLAAGTAAAFLVARRRLFPALLVLAGASAVPVCLAAAGFAIMSPYFSLEEDARAINREIAARPEALVACEARPNTASSLLYYLNARVHWVNAPFDNQYAQQVLGLGRDYYWDEATLRQEWNSSAPVYLIVEESRLSFWRGRLPGGWRLVHAGGSRLVLCNR